MKEDPRYIERASHILFIAQSLHRVADQASNVAEEVIFTNDGKVVRHHLEDYHPMPIVPNQDKELVECEKKVVKSARSRYEVEQDLVKRQSETVCMSKDIIEAQALGAREKALKAREKLLRHQASKRTK